jgi:hypothetical protein
MICYSEEICHEKENIGITTPPVQNPKNPKIALPPPNSPKSGG